MFAFRIHKRVTTRRHAIMKKILYALIVLLSVACNHNQKTEFSLTGETNGIENGTILYLDNSLANILIDSAVVENNKFKFQTKLSVTPLYVILRTGNGSHYRYFWLENKPMFFNGAKADFKHAIITGSETENLKQTLNKQVDTLHGSERQKLEREFVINNPVSIVSSQILSVYATSWGKEKTAELFNKFSEDNKNSAYGKKIANYLSVNKEPKIGDLFIDFEMSDQNGKSKRLSDLKGKTILLEFWASNCSPCRQQNANLVKTYLKFKPKGFEIFAVSLDQEQNSWLQAIEEDKLIWEHVSDLKGDDNEASLIYGVNGIPDNFLIDRNGIIVGRNLRGDELNEKLAEIMPVGN
jgi:peroxiredoxin